MLTISRSARLSKSPDGGVLLDVDLGVVFSLNPVATRIVELLQSGNSVTTLADAISREFQVSSQVATSDVDNFLIVLETQKLLHESRAESRSSDGGA
jgi:Coenzyme PQQ synthesis protein D (PqqD)